MKKKKKLIIIVLILICIIILLAAIYYFSPKIFLKGIDKAKVKSIHVFDGSNGNTFIISNTDEIVKIVENIQEIKMKRDKLASGYVGFSFSMSFIDENNNTIDSFVINSSSTIRDDTFFYKCDDELCYDYLKELAEKYEL